MKNILVVDGALNCVYDIFAATDEEFALFFPPGEDIAFIGEVIRREDPAALDAACEALWTRRVPKVRAQGIHGTLFYELEHKKACYPTRRDEDAVNCR